MQRHVAIDDPAEDDEEGRDEQGDLQRRPERDAHGQVHLVLDGDDDGRDVLGGVADDGEQDQADERLGDVGRLDERVDAVDEELGADGHGDGHDDEHGGRGPGAHLGLVFILRFGLGFGFGVEEVGVGAQLEEEVEHVEDEEDDGCAAREREDVGLGVLVGLREDGEELGEGGRVRLGLGAIEGGVALTVAGMISAAEATAMREDMVDATVELNSCSIPLAVPVRVLLMPPARKQHPRTRRMLDRMLPSILDWTILISPFLRATMLTCRHC